MGSKRRIAKDILPIILRDRKEGQWYVEPFVGAGNLIDKVDGLRIGADTNKYIIKLLQETQEGRVFPTVVSEDDYKYTRDHKDEDPALTAFIGFGCSFGGKWFGGYARERKIGKVAHSSSSSKILRQQSIGLKGVVFIHSPYEDLLIPEGAIVYCDPPYTNTVHYKDKFDNERFWNWCRYLVKKGHQVFVSEYKAPEDFACIWEKKVEMLMRNNANKEQRVERLFIHESQLEKQKIERLL